jgi:phage terminase Nu1 subunit (DNA packaging protein)
MTSKIAYTTLSASVVADVLGISTRRVNQLAEARILPRSGTGFELRGAVRAYLANLREEIRPATLADAQARLTGAKARIAEIQRDRLEGELVAIGDVAAAVAKEYSTVRQRLLAIPSRVAPVAAVESDPRKIHDAVEREIASALSELSSDAAKLAQAHDVIEPV